MRVMGWWGRSEWAVGSGQWAVGSGQWAVGSGQWANEVRFCKITIKQLINSTIN
jgi:hypothetical protein